MRSSPLRRRVEVQVVPIWGHGAAPPNDREDTLITEAASPDARLDRATELSRTSLSSIHSSEGAWQQASALALVSIARSLESIVTTLDREQQGVPASNGGASR
jgi:hypothetical protein